MADREMSAGGQQQKTPVKLKDMGDGTWAEVVAGILAAGSAIIGKVGPIPITTATHSNVSAAAADTVLLAANAARLPGSTITNDSTAILYIKLGGGASATSYWVAIDGKTTVGGNAILTDGYTGAVNGFWASATGSARVTEMT